MALPQTPRVFALMAMLLATANSGLAAKLTDKEHTRIEEPRPANLPTDETMEAEGAVIGNVEIDIRNIFDESDPRERTGLFRLADRLHLRTRRSTIRAQLLFASGQKYRARKLAETERVLRLQRYIYDARVVPVRYVDGKVDIKVITKDVWTLSPGISFGRAGGANATDFNLQDSNFLGLGQTVQVSRSSTVDRTTDSVAWADPNMFGSRWSSALEYDHSSDGGLRKAEVVQPFYSLDAPWTAKLTAVEFDRTVSRYNLGQIVDQLHDDQTSYELSGGVSTGLVDGWTKRLLFGMRYDRNLFMPAPRSTLQAQQLPADRTLSYPFVGFDILQDKYKKAGDENQIGRTEDLYFGTEVTGEFGVSRAAFGANRDAYLLAASLLHGYEISVQQQLFFLSTFSTRIEDGLHVRNLIADNGAKYYWKWRPDWLLYVAVSTTVTDSLDPELQLLLGGDNGLRGYPLRYESGTSRAIFTVEQRVFTDWYPFRLARVGAAVFSDVGRTWGRGVVGDSDPGLLRDVGFGLRLGNTRTGLGNVLHVDLAFPLTRATGIQRFQFLVQTFQSF
jgi:outer membrane protein assembly factor BamA